MAYTIKPQIACTNCNNFLYQDKEYIRFYFFNVKVKCPHCEAVLDWWTLSLKYIRINLMGTFAFNILGANTTIITETLIPKEILKISFSNYGIPKGAKILNINTTPGGGLHPIEYKLGNDLKQERRIIEEEISFYPIAIRQSKQSENTPIDISITWLECKDDNIAKSNLIQAFEAYSNKSYVEAILPANIAVEYELLKLLNNFMRKHVGKKQTEDFLKNTATYSSQINIVLPLIISILNLPPLPNNIRGLVNKLRKYRNQIAHSGKLDKSITKNEISDSLCAAVFSVEYISLMNNTLNQEVQNKDN